MEQQQGSGVTRSVRQILRSARNSITGEPLLASEKLLQVDAGSGLSVTFVVDRSCSAGADERAWDSIREALRRYAVSNLQEQYEELSVLEISGSQIRIAGDFSYPPVFQFEDAARGDASGLSPVLCAVCTACERAVMRAKPEGDKRHLVIVLSDFCGNDARYVVPVGSNYIALDTKAIEDRIWAFGCSSVTLIRGRIGHDRDNCPALPGVTLPFGGDLLTEAGVAGGLYRLHRYLAVQQDPALADQPDDPFLLPQEQVHQPHRMQLQDVRCVYTAHSLFPDGMPERAAFLQQKLPAAVYPVMPVAVLLDASISAAEFLAPMKAAVQHLADSLYNRSGRGSADLAVYAITADGIRILRDFSGSYDAVRSGLQTVMPETAGTVSPLLTAAAMMRRRLAQRTAQWQEARADVLPPMMLLLSDFLPNDFTATDAFASAAEMRDVLTALDAARQQEHLKILCFRCGNASPEMQDTWCRLLSGASANWLSAAELSVQPELLTDTVLSALEQEQPIPVPKPSVKPVQKPAAAAEKVSPVPDAPSPAPQEKPAAEPENASAAAASPAPAPPQQNGGYSQGEGGWTMNQAGGFVIRDRNRP
ncbi:MAG TPA: hypothetical protein DDX71_07215 [Ruminococcus sp.]|nr:hypothetical protein [Ruminococcus sp.]